MMNSALLSLYSRRAYSSQAGVSGRSLEESLKNWDATKPLFYVSEQSKAHSAKRLAAPSNAMIIHPWIPVHVRYALLGIFLGGSYYYLSTTGQLKQLEERWSQAGLPDLRKVKLPDLSSIKVPALPDIPRVDVSKTVEWLKTLDPRGAPSAKTPAPPGEEGQSSSKTGAVLPEAQLKETEQDLKPEDIAVIEQLFKEALGPAVEEAGQAAAAASDKAAVSKAAAAPTSEKQEDSKIKASFPGMEDDVNHATKELEEAHDALQVIRDSISDVGHTVLMKDSHEQLKKRVHLEMYKQRLASGGNETEELVLHSAGMLGLADNISSSQLVKKAVDMGLGSAGDRSSSQAAHRQALADVETIKGILQQIADYHNASLAEEAEATAKWAAKAREYLGLAEETVERMSALLEEERRSAEKTLRDSLDTQQLELSVNHSSELTRERLQRHGAIDELRLRVNALSRAFEARSNELKASESAHVMAATVIDLCVSLAQGAPVGTEVETLRSRCGDDPLVAAVLNSLPPRALSSGISSERGLLESWPAIKRSVAVKTALPAQGGGLLSTAIAHLAASLKFNERGSTETSVSAASMDSKLAQVESRLFEGRLAEATAQLEELVQGMPAARNVQDWLAAARARVLTEQAVALLQAHANVLHATSVGA